jgi:putative acetyltransferase
MDGLGSLTGNGGSLRSYRPADGAALERLYRASVTAIGPGHYTPEQVAAWAARAPSPARLDMLMADGRLGLVAEGKGGAPLAFADLERDGHIHFFYCAPEAAGTGVAAALYARLEAAAREQGIALLWAEASEPALRFFRRRGFTLLHRRDFEIGGVPIHNYAVEKRLDPAGDGGGG